MQLIRCHIDNFGILSDLDLEFEEGRNDLCQENGWGKSTLVAFLRAMFYGLGNDRKQGILANERKRYRPWQGGNFGGNLTFRTKGMTYTIYRSFGNSAKEDLFELRETRSNRISSRFSSRIGEELFQIDRDSFIRTAIVQQDAGYMGSSSGINAKISNLTADTNDLNNFDIVNMQLQSELNTLSESRSTGAIARKKREIAELEAQLVHAPSDRELEGCLQQKHILEESIDRLNERQAEIHRMQQQAARLQDRAGIAARLRQSQDEAQERKKQMDKAKESFPGLLPDKEELDLCYQKTLQLELQEADYARAALSEEEEIRLEDLDMRFAAGIPELSEIEDARKKLETIHKLMADNLAGGADNTAGAGQSAGAGYAAGDGYMPGAGQSAGAGYSGNQLPHPTGEILLGPGTGNSREGSSQNKGGQSKGKAAAKSHKDHPHRLSGKYEFCFGPRERHSFLRWFIEADLLMNAISALIALLLLLTSARTLLHRHFLAALLCAALFTVIVHHLLAAWNRKTGDSFIRLRKKALPEPVIVQEKQPPLQELELPPVYREEADPREGDGTNGMISPGTDIGPGNREDGHYMRDRIQLLSQEVEDFLLDYEAVSPGQRGTAPSIEERLRLLENEVREYLNLGERSISKEELKNQMRQTSFELICFLQRNGIPMHTPLTRLFKELCSARENYQLHKEEYDRILTRIEADKLELQSLGDAMQELLLPENQEALAQELQMISAQLEELRSSLPKADNRIKVLREAQEQAAELSVSLNRQKEELEQLRHHAEIVRLTKESLIRAQESFTARYTRPVMEAFLFYLRMIDTEGDEIYYLDSEGNLTVEGGGMQREIGVLSKGLQDMAGICMRMALLDAMYPGEKPFVILDDPFVNLDDQRFAGAMEFLDRISRDYQILYLTCSGRGKKKT